MTENSDEKLGALLREMSHELRTPLTSIMGFSELLLEDETLTGQTREYLTIINDESRKLSSMLNHYLSILSVQAVAPHSESED
jgi:signal transduction histidine kinase